VRFPCRVVLVAVAVALLWLTRALPLVVSLAWNNYGSVRLNRALLASGQAAQSRQADVAGAGAAFQSALAWLPGNGLAYYNLGDIYGTWGQPGAAAEALSKAAAELPWDVNTHFQLGQVYEALGREDLAEPEWSRAKAAHFFVTQSRAQVAQDDSLAARHSLEIALALEPGLPEAHYALGRLVANEGETALAIQSYQAGLAMDHSPTSQLAAKAQVALLQQDWPAALKYCQQAQAVEPGNPALVVRLGQAYADLGRTEQAAAYYQQAIQLDPAYVSAYAALVGLYAQAGNCSQAERTVEQTPAVQRAGDLLAGLEADAALCYLRANQPARAGAQRAISLLERAVERSPDVAWYRLNLAQAYTSTGQFQAAIREYRQVLQLDPANARARAGLQGLNAAEK
jgi:tetratricopeptide (TPR) repeat protein